MSYDNTITEPEKHVLDCEYRKGFESGMDIRPLCKFMFKEYHSESYLKCSKCNFGCHREIVIDNSFHYCPNCGAKIVEVEK